MELPFQQLVLSCQAIDTIIAFTSCSYESTEGICCVLSGDNMSVLIDVTNIDLHRCMIFSGNETVRRGTINGQKRHKVDIGDEKLPFARHVEINNFSLILRESESACPQKALTFSMMTCNAGLATLLKTDL